jgi:hypothetical protein
MFKKVFGYIKDRKVYVGFALGVLVSALVVLGVSGQIPEQLIDAFFNAVLGAAQ